MIIHAFGLEWQVVSVPFHDFLEVHARFEVAAPDVSCQIELGRPDSFAKLAYEDLMQVLGLYVTHNISFDPGTQVAAAALVLFTSAVFL